MKPKFAVIAVLTMFGCGEYHIDDVILPHSLTPGYVLIEFEKPTCPDASGFRRQFRVDSSGYACTASKIGNSKTNYFRLETSGKLRALDLGKDVFVPTTLGRTVGGRCNVQAFKFLYGHPKTISNDRSWIKILHDHHPECPDVFRF